MTTSKKRFGVLAGLALSLGAAGSTKAALVLVLNEPGFPTTTITDGGAGDGDTIVNGQIIFSGNYGHFSTTIDVATSNSPGSGSGGEISLNAVQIKSPSGTAAGIYPLSLAVEDAGFTFPGSGAVQLNSYLSGTLSPTSVNDSITQTSFIDTANDADASASPTASAPPASYTSPSSSPEVFAQATNNPSTLLAGTYSLADVVGLSLSSTSIVSFNANTQTVASVVAVPEPTSIALLASGGVLLLRRRRAR